MNAKSRRELDERIENAITAADQLLVNDEITQEEHDDRIRRLKGWQS